MSETATSLSTAEERLAARIARRMPEGTPAFAVRFAGGSRTFGTGQPGATIVATSARALEALASLDRTRVAEAYRDGVLDVEGDIRRLLAVRTVFRDLHPLTWVWRFVKPLLAGRQRSDAAWIAEHYDYDADFYKLFLDRRHRCYSQAIFARDDEPLECAQTRKLEFALEAIQARPGDRVLDIGGGWGAFVEFAGERGIRVTSLTISRASEAFIQALIDDRGLPCEVLREHLFAHQPAGKYDAIVNLGVTEHLPDYPRTLARYAQLLEPGGRIYLDASAARRRHRLSGFFLRHIFPGNGTLMSLPQYLAAVGRTRFEVLAVYNDRHNYGLTTRQWAVNLDHNAEEIIARWGEPLYRTFRLYLWGCVDGFARDMLQAYRVVLRLPEEP